MFTRQAQQMNESLWQGGLSAAQAHVVANALGQCRQTLDHRGPVQIDYTTPQMKLVLPEIAQIQFPDIQLQPPEAIPPRPRNPRIPTRPPEEEIPYNPDPLPPPQGPDYPGTGNDPGGGGGSEPITPNCCVPQWLMTLLEDAYKQWEDYKKKIDTEFAETRLESGNFIDVDYNGLSVDLITSNEGEGNICTFDTDTIKGLSKEEFVDSISDLIDEKVEENLEDAGTGTTMNVISGISLSGTTLSIQTCSVRVLEKGSCNNDSDIQLTEC